jgi:hypothetical protein
MKLGRAWAAERKGRNTMSTKNLLADLAVSDTGFVFDPFTGTTFTVNPTGLCLLQAFKEGLGRKQAVERLADRFDTKGANVPRELDEFVQLLRQNGVVPSDFSVS